MIRTLLYILFYMIFSSCNSHSKDELDKSKINRVIYSTGPCLGDCPSLSIEIDKNLNYKYFGGAEADLTGFYKGKVNQYFWGTFTKKLEKSYYQNLLPSYRYGYLDLSSKEIIIYYDQSRKVIEGDSKSIPPELSDALSWLENSYPYIELQKADTLVFETRLHQFFMNATPFLQAEEDSLKKLHDKMRNK